MVFKRSLFFVLSAIFNYLLIMSELKAEERYEEKIVWLFNTSTFFDRNKTSIGFNTTRMLLDKFNTGQDYNYQIRSLSEIKKLMRNTSLKEKSTYCAPFRVKTIEREKFNYFSQPVQLHPSHYLYFSDKNYPLPKSSLDKDGKLISLSTLFNELPEQYLTVIKGISFGSELDQQIEKLATNNVQKMEKIIEEITPIQLLAKDRINFTLVYPEALKNYSPKKDNSDNTIHSISINNHKSYVLGRIACTKTPAGKKIINNINKILDNLYTEKKFYDAHIKHLIYSDLEHFKKDFTHVFHERYFE